MPPRKGKSKTKTVKSPASNEARAKSPSSSTPSTPSPTPGGEGTTFVPGPPDLPATAWGHVLDYLPYSDVRKVILVCREIYFEATKHASHLFVYNAAELNAKAVTRRLVNVTRVAIGCLLLPDNTLNVKAIWKIVPFLQALPKLTRCFIGGFEHGQSIRRTMREYTIRSCAGPRDHSYYYKSMLESFCGAFEAGAISNSLELVGILNRGSAYICQPSVENPRRPCRLCRRILMSFPLNILICVPGRTNDRLVHQAAPRFCVPHDECLSIMRSRSQSERCVGLPVNSNIFQLHYAEVRPYSNPSRIRKVYYICRETLLQVELWNELELGPKRLSSLTREEVMKTIKSDRPDGGYALAKVTFDRLVKAGFDLDERDFILVEKRDDIAMRHLARDYSKDSLQCFAFLRR